MAAHVLPALIAAVENGRESRRLKRPPNPYEPGTVRAAAFLAGRNNDLSAWMDIFNKYRTPAPTKSGRFKAMDRIVYLEGSHLRDAGYFRRYRTAGRALVLLKRGGSKTVGLEDLTRPGKI